MIESAKGIYASDVSPALEPTEVPVHLMPTVNEANAKRAESNKRNVECDWAQLLRLFIGGIFRCGSSCAEGAQQRTVQRPLTVGGTTP